MLRFFYQASKLIKKLIFCYFCAVKVNKLGRIIAIDYGKKRTGIAVTDPLQIIAGVLDTVSTHEASTLIAKYISTEKVDEIVVGNPLMLDGTASETMELMAPFVNRLRKLFPDIPVVLYDERFTSKIAMRSMIESGAKKSDRQNKKNLDRISAVLLLQSYMEWKNNHLNTPLCSKARYIPKKES